MFVNGSPNDLTVAQRSALHKMRKGKRYTAVELHASLATLRVLEREGLVECSYGLGGVESPRTSVSWART